MQLEKSTTIGECWIKSILHVTQHGMVGRDEDVEICEVLGLSYEILEPRYDDPIIARIGDSEIVERTLAKFSRGVEMPDRPFTYGALIFDHYGIDQFEWLVDRLQSKRETKSATIGLLVPGSQSKNLPCLTTIDAKIRNERLELQCFYRSQNIFGRQYSNLLALAKLQADISKRCSVVPGAMRAYVASAHIYAFDLADARRIVSGEIVAIRDRYYAEGPLSIRANSSADIECASFTAPTNA